MTQSQLYVLWVKNNNLYLKTIIGLPHSLTLRYRHRVYVYHVNGWNDHVISKYRNREAIQTSQFNNVKEKIQIHDRKICFTCIAHNICWKPFTNKIGYDIKVFEIII